MKQATDDGRHMPTLEHSPKAAATATYTPQSHDANPSCTNISAAMSTALNLGAWRDRTNLYASPHAPKPQPLLTLPPTASSPTANHIHTTLQAAANQAALEEAMTRTARAPAY